MVTLLRLLSFVLVIFIPVKSQEIVQSSKIQCDAPMKDAIYDLDMIVGKSWRVYYTWNWIYETPSKCVNIKFTLATPAVVDRIYNEMADYMRSPPPWDAATMVMALGKEEHELLLFADMKGPAGRFLAVPNIVRDSVNLTPHRGAVPLLHFFIQLVNDGQFLVVIDCQVGVGTLSATAVPYRVDVAQAAARLDLGQGHMVCTQEMGKGEVLPEE